MGGRPQLRTRVRNWMNFERACEIGQKRIQARGPELGNQRHIPEHQKRKDTMTRVTDTQKKMAVFIAKHNLRKDSGKVTERT